MYTKYTGIILKKHPLDEADELLTIFTVESGKMRVKAQGTRKIKSRLAGNLQSLNEVSFETATGRRTTNLPVLISVRALTINNYLRENLRKFAYALVGIETLYRLMGDRQENGEAYHALRHFLKHLGESRSEDLVVRRFQLNLLGAAGYGFPQSWEQADEKSLRQIRALLSGEDIPKLDRKAEGVIDGFVNYILEREIKSSKLLDTLT